MNGGEPEPSPIHLEVRCLRQHRRVFVALDNTPDAMEKNRGIAKSLGATALIPRLLDVVKDANDWVAQHGTTAETVQDVLNKAKTRLQSEIERIAFLPFSSLIFFTKGI